MIDFSKKSIPFLKCTLKACFLDEKLTWQGILLGIFICLSMIVIIFIVWIILKKKKITSYKLFDFRMSNLIELNYSENE